MAKPMKPAQPINPEVERRRRLQELAQEHKALAFNSLFAMLQNPSIDRNAVEANTELAVKYADAMMDALYVKGKDKEQE